MRTEFINPLQSLIQLHFEDMNNISNTEVNQNAFIK